MMHLTDMRTIQDLMQRYNFHVSRHMGQNFLIDDTICPRMAELGHAAPGQGILEIGPGFGALTQQLAIRAEKVVALELDARLLPILQETVGEFSNIHLLQGDILKTDLPALLNNEFVNLPVSVCANLPYYITTPILMYLLESNCPFSAITVMIQDEVAEKLTASIGTRSAGAITVAVQYYGTVQKLFDVPRTSFYPSPQVDSAVIQITPQLRYVNVIQNSNHFFAMVKNGFSQRRKTLVNGLSSTMNYDKKDLERCLASLSISPQERFENLSMEQLIALSNCLCDLKTP